MFGLHPGSEPVEALARVRGLPPAPTSVLGLGLPLLPPGQHRVAPLRAFPAVTGPGVSFPSTQGALWTFLRGADPGEILHQARTLRAALGDAFRLDEDVPTFKYGSGRDLSGYEDGTENPTDERAVATAIVAGEGDGLDGSSFVAGQKWIHDLARLERMPQAGRDQVIGRRLDSNEEIADAPASAHVKRAAQESFEPTAFMVRRSMPWGDVGENGLYFVAFGATLDPFERVLRRMAGQDDGITDGLLRFSHAVSGGYYWCPPLRDGRLDLRALDH